MICYRRHGSPFIAFRRRTFYGILLFGAIAASMLFGYTASLSVTLDEAQTRIELLETQIRANEQLLIPPQKKPAPAD